MRPEPGLFEGVTLALALAGAGAVLLHLTRDHGDTLRYQARIFLLALALRFGVACLVYAGGLVAVVGDEDASGWAGGVGLREQWMREGVGPLELPFAMLAAFVQPQLGYRYLLAAWFLLTGCPVRLAAAALNAWFGALTVILAYRTCRLLFPERCARRVAWWTTLFPSLIIWSALTVKEPVVIFLEALVVYSALAIRARGPAPAHVLACVGGVLCLLPFRFYAAFVLGAAAVLAVLTPARGRSLRTAPAAALIAILGLGLVVGGSMARQEAILARATVGGIEEFRSKVAEPGPTGGARSGVRVGYDLHTPYGVAMSVAVGGAHLLLAPFPWQLSQASARMLLTLPEVAAWWILAALGLLPGAIHCARRRFFDCLPLFAVLLGLGLLYSLMFGNVGLVYRQRAQLLPWLFIIAAAGLELRAAARDEERVALIRRAEARA